MSSSVQTIFKTNGVASTPALPGTSDIQPMQAAKAQRLTLKILEQLNYSKGRNVDLFARRNGVEAMLFTVPAKLLMHFSPTLKCQLEQDPTLKKIDLDFPKAHVKWLYSWMRKGGELAKYEPFESEKGKELEDQEILKKLAEHLKVQAVIQYTDKNVAVINDPGLPRAQKTVPMLKGPICYNCNEAGHIKRLCPKEPGTTRSALCLRCGQSCHGSKDCDFMSNLTPVSGSVTLEDQYGYQHTFPLKHLTCRRLGTMGSAKYQFSASARIPEWDLGQGRIAENLRRVNNWE